MTVTEVLGEGMVEVGGSAIVQAALGAGQVDSDIVVEWDLDNDGDFDQPEEDITSYVRAITTSTGRDWPSNLNGKSQPGQLKALLRNDDDRFNYFNTASPLATAPFSLETGRKLRVRAKVHRALDLTGASGSYASTPTVDIDGGDMVIGCEVSPADLTAAAAQVFVSQWDPTGNQRAFMLAIDVNGQLRTIHSTDGTLAAQVINTAPLPLSFTRRQAIWAWIDVDDGGGNHVVRWYTAERLTDTPVLFATKTTAGTTSIFSTSTAPLEVGSQDVGTAERLTGQVYAAEVRVGDITSTDVRSFVNFAAQVAGDTSFEADTGETWTVHGAAELIEDPNASAVDPVPLARDRFLGSGVLGSDELGNPWTVRQGSWARGPDSAGDTLASPSPISADPHIATIDLGGPVDYYAQARFKFIDGDNSAGIVYRYQDNDNYGRVVILSDNATFANVAHYTRSGGVDTLQGFFTCERRRDMTLGLLLQGETLTAYLEGVPVFTDSGAADVRVDNEPELGIWADWNDQRAPAFHEFYVWDTVQHEVEGVLWTGHVSALMPSVQPGPEKSAELQGEGRLATLADTEISGPASVGVTFYSTGCEAGLLVGNVLAEAVHLHPPGILQQGAFPLGATGRDPSKALDLAREYEEADLGFIYEMQEGPIGYDARAARAGATVEVAFSDDPDQQFAYETLVPFDWRKEITNRVEAGVSPQAPVFINTFGTQASTAAGVPNDIDITMPSAGFGIEGGDLCLIFIASTISTTGTEWLVPTGWKAYRDAGDALGKQRIYAKVLEDEDLGQSFQFYNDTSSGGAYVWHMWVFEEWFGDLDQGVEVAPHYGVGQPNTDELARSGFNRPPTIFPTWGPEPSMFLVTRAGFTSVDGGAVTGGDDNAPGGYDMQNSTFQAGSVNGFDVAQQIAFREAAVSVESPGPFNSEPGIFEGFDYVETTVVAVRGSRGDPPSPSGALQTVIRDDVASQDSHNAVRKHTNASGLFATVADAEAYGDIVLATYANDRPIFRMSFTANKTAAHRAQALRRRVGDKIQLTASGNAGMGVDGAFFIENIENEWSHGTKLWEVTWELSPA